MCTGYMATLCKNREKPKKNSKNKSSMEKLKHRNHYRRNKTLRKVSGFKLVWRVKWTYKKEMGIRLKIFTAKK